MKPRLYLFIGYPGAGKTTIAQLIAARTGAVHLWADYERLQQFGQPTHEDQENQQLYGRLNTETEHLLQQGKSVIFDTNFNLRHDRDHLRQIAAANGAEVVIIWVTTPAETAKQRAVHDQNLRNGYLMPMSEEQFDKIASHLEPPTEDEKIIKIDGSKLDQPELMRLLGL